MPTPSAQPPAPSDSITALIPYAHVADVERSLTFYALLGFTSRNTHADPGGRIFWAEAVCGQASIMLAQASGPVAADQQAVLFYLYCSDVASLRTKLLAHGVPEAAKHTGDPAPNDGRGAVVSLARPFYMPAGELRLHDPDGYVLLIGQLS